MNQLDFVHIEMKRNSIRKLVYSRILVPALKGVSGGISTFDFDFLLTKST